MHIKIIIIIIVNSWERVVNSIFSYKKSNEIKLQT
jgi:hypothetical protein